MELFNGYMVFWNEILHFWVNHSWWCFGLLAHSFFSPTAAKLGPETSVLGLHVRKLQMWTPTGPLLLIQPWSSTNCWENTPSRNPRAGAFYELHVWISFGSIWSTASPHLLLHRTCIFNLHSSEGLKGQTCLMCTFEINWRFYTWIRRKVSNLNSINIWGYKKLHAVWESISKLNCSFILGMIYFQKN